MQFFLDISQYSAIGKLNFHKCLRKYAWTKNIPLI